MLLDNFFREDTKRFHVKHRVIAFQIPASLCKFLLLENVKFAGEASINYC